MADLEEGEADDEGHDCRGEQLRVREGWVTPVVSRYATRELNALLVHRGRVGRLARGGRVGGREFGDGRL